MLICIKCGRTYERGRFCQFCGTLLRDKEINYETSHTLLRSNVVIDNVDPIQAQRASLIKQEIKKKNTNEEGQHDIIGKGTDVIPTRSSYAEYGTEKNSGPRSASETNRNMFGIDDRDIFSDSRIDPRNYQVSKENIIYSSSEAAAVSNDNASRQDNTSDVINENALDYYQDVEIDPIPVEIEDYPLYDDEITEGDSAPEDTVSVSDDVSEEEPDIYSSIEIDPIPVDIDVDFYINADNTESAEANEEEPIEEDTPVVQPTAEIEPEQLQSQTEEPSVPVEDESAEDDISFESFVSGYDEANEEEPEEETPIIQPTAGTEPEQLQSQTEEPSVLVEDESAEDDVSFESFVSGYDEANEEEPEEETPVTQPTAEIEPEQLQSQTEEPSAPVEEENAEDDISFDNFVSELDEANEEEPEEETPIVPPTAEIEPEQLQSQTEEPSVLVEEESSEDDVSFESFVLKLKKADNIKIEDEAVAVQPTAEIGTQWADIDESFAADLATESKPTQSQTQEPSAPVEEESSEDDISFESFVSGYDEANEEEPEEETPVVPHKAEIEPEQVQTEEPSIPVEDESSEDDISFESFVSGLDIANEEEPEEETPVVPPKAEIEPEQVQTEEPSIPVEDESSEDDISFESFVSGYDEANEEELEEETPVVPPKAEIEQEQLQTQIEETSAPVEDESSEVDLDFDSFVSEFEKTATPPVIPQPMPEQSQPVMGATPPVMPQPMTEQSQPVMGATPPVIPQPMPEQSQPVMGATPPVMSQPMPEQSQPVMGATPPVMPQPMPEQSQPVMGATPPVMPQSMTEQSQQGVGSFATPAEGTFQQQYQVSEANSVSAQTMYGNNSLQSQNTASYQNTGYELDEMFGEQPNMTFTIYRPGESFAPPKKSGWFSRDKKKASGKKKKK